MKEQAREEFAVRSSVMRHLRWEQFALAPMCIGFSSVGLLLLVGERPSIGLYLFLAGLGSGVAFFRTTRFLHGLERGEYTLILDGRLLSLRRGEAVPLAAISSLKFDRFFYRLPVRARLTCNDTVSWKYRRFNIDLRLYDHREELIAALKNCMK